MGARKVWGESLCFEVFILMIIIIIIIEASLEGKHHDLSCTAKKIKRLRVKVGLHFFSGKSAK